MNFSLRELKFTLNLKPGSPCQSVARFDEGVIVAIGNWNNSGQWIPLKYYARTATSERRLDIKIGDIESGNITFLRGYPVPFIENVTVLNESIQICNEDILRRDGVQVRWLQTASIYTEENVFKDTWTLDDVSVILHLNETYSEVLLEDNFDHQDEIKYVCVCMCINDQ